MSRPDSGHKEKLCIGLAQLGEKLMRRKDVCPQILSWKRKGVHYLGPGIWHWRHKSWKFGVPPGGKQVHMGRAPWAEHVPCDLRVE